MLSDIRASVKANWIIVVVVLGLGLITTTARICVRRRTRRLWWDDGCAFLVTLATMLMTVGYFLCNTSKPPTSAHTREARIIQMWVLITTYTSAVWLGRMSLILSVIRLIPPFLFLRRVAGSVFITFLMIGLSILTIKIYFCASDRSWYQSSVPTCQLGGQTWIALYGAIACLLADSALIAIPLRLLRHVGLESNQRRMLVLMFSVNLITSAITIVRTVFVVGNAWSLVSVAVVAEVGTVLIAANLAVLTPYIYRLFRREGDFDSKPCPYYRSVQPDGAVHLRRVADLAPNTINNSPHASSTHSKDGSETLEMHQG